MTDADFILSVLEDGKPHSTNEIILRSLQERGCGLTVHSRVSQLRERGHYITCDLAGRVNGRPIYEYKLLGSLPESPQSVASSPNGDAHKDTLHLLDDGRGDSESEQLFTYPRSPEWA